MGKDLKGKDIGIGFTQRGDGRYQARFTVNGKKYCLYGTKLSELRKEVDAKKREATEIQNRDSVSLSEWFTEWFSSYKAPMLKSDLSRNSYRRRCLNTYIRILGDMDIADIMQRNVQLATNELSGLHKKKYIREALGGLRECLDIAVVNRMIRTNPCVAINIREDEYIMNERVVFTQKQQELILKEVEGKYYEEVYKILLLTGMRIGEFSGLRWEDIDWNNRCIHINRSMMTGYVNHKKIEQLTPPKTYNAVRTIPFFDDTAEVLMSWKEKQDSYKKKLGKHWRVKPEHGDLVFTSTQGSPVTRYVITRDMRRIEEDMKLKYSDVPHIHPHAFRHTFCTRCFDKGMNPVVVQKIMGHANYSTTVGYTHPDEEMADEVRRVGRFLTT